MCHVTNVRLDTERYFFNDSGSGEAFVSNFVIIAVFCEEGNFPVVRDKLTIRAIKCDLHLVLTISLEVGLAHMIFWTMQCPCNLTRIHIDVSFSTITFCVHINDPVYIAGQMHRYIKHFIIKLFNS